MSFVSYAQNFEDVMLWRALKHVEQGFYIDVGAYDPDLDSVTKAFYERGWRGINIEPVPQWFERLERSRPRDINLQLALGASPGEMTLYEIPDTGLSTTEKELAERHKAERGYEKRELRVKMDTLTRVCERFHVAAIHFLKIDVEGAEKAVLKGADFDKIRPWIILVESTLPLSQEASYSDWEPLLLEAGYEYVYFDGLNRFYIAREHESLRAAFKAPPNIFDDFISSRHLEAKRRAQRAEDRAQRAEDRAQQAEASLLAVYNSRSWRMTAPFRWLTGALRRVGRKTKQVVKQPAKPVKRLVALLLAYSIRFVYVRPWLKRPLSAWIKKHPRLEARLRLIIAARGPIPIQALQMPEAQLQSHLQVLSPRAREIYYQLKAAIEQNKKENG